jgi:phosphoribosylglycinamide formyltransferase 1
MQATPSSAPLKIAVLGSGSGSNCQSIIDAIAAGTLNARIVCVVADVEGAAILARARRHNIPAHYLSGMPFKTKLEGEAETRYITLLKAHGAEVIALAGFMRIIKRRMLEAFPERIVNIHPALLPAFPGVESWKQALDYGAKVTGCTVHYVDEGTDTGPIIIQRVVSILDDDTPAALHARIQAEEHRAYPEALRLLAAGALRRSGRRVLCRRDQGP